GEWSPESVEMCAKRQALILEEAAKMVKPGGVLTYSTCTFSPEENEGTISAFLRAHEEYYIEETNFEGVFSPGRADWVEEPGAGIEHTLRLWPHLIRGEGHYIAKLRKRGKLLQGDRQESWKISGDKKLSKLVEAFLREELGISDSWMEQHPGQITKFGDQIYLVPGEMISLAGIKVLRPGLHLLTEKKNRFEPAHALAGTLTKKDVSKRMELTEAEAVSYLRGESLRCGEERGFTVLFYEAYALGFGKASGGQMKNHYPKGLRISL
nr:RsmF rRNA methyltransferase first C-terminal domain-containing protein [Lachnospiraceae bacterium]